MIILSYFLNNRMLIKANLKERLMPLFIYLKPR
nr:MAG TPA: hypothetical protein [Caudoviricetes sp.]